MNRNNALRALNSNGKMLTPFSIALIYCIIGNLWILFSDQATHFLFKNPEIVLKISLFKGWFYVLATTLLLYFLISKLQKRIQIKEEHFRGVFDGINDAIFIHDIDTGAILDVNQRTEELYGFTKNEILELTVDKISSGIPPYSAEEASRHLHKALDGNPNIFEWRCKRKDGTLFWGEVNMKLVHMQPRDRIIVTLRNIDEWKKAQDALRENAETFKKIFNSNAVLMAVSTLEEGLYLDVNETFLSVLGFRREEIIGHSSKELNLWGNIEDRTKAMDIFLKQGKVRAFDTMIRTKNGEIRNALFSVDRIVFNDINCILSTMTDYTERKQAEKLLIKSEAQLKRAERIARLGHWEFNLETRGVSASEGAHVIYGLGYKNWTIENIKTIPLPEYREFLNKAMNDLIEKNKPYDVEFQILRPTDGEILNIRSMAEYDPEKKVIFGVIYDITETKKMQENLEKAQKMESLGVLAGGIAHDFNNLLGGLFGYIELALLSVANPQAVTENLNQALAIINQTRGLTLQLLTFAKGGGMNCKTKALPPLLKQAATFALHGSNVSPEFSIPEDLWLCDIDEARIGQVVQNIVINAKQAMENGGKIYISAENRFIRQGEHPLLEQGKYVKIVIRDEGPGIPKNVLPRIFDPFFTTKAKGNGLGLSICYSIIKKHEGIIDVESAPQKGTTFIIHLKASSFSSEEHRPEPGTIHRGQGNILVMDDEEFIREVCDKMLGAMGYSVLKTKDGKETLDIFLKSKTLPLPMKAVLLDLTIPGGMGGRETAEALRQISREVILIAMSGYSREDIIAHPEKYGFNASLQKPFTLEELSRLMNRLFP